MRELARDDYARRAPYPGPPLAGFSERTTGVPAVTVNRLLPVATSLPVVTSRCWCCRRSGVDRQRRRQLRGAGHRHGARRHPRVAERHCRGARTKCVNWPVICTPVNTWPCFPLVGLITLTAGGLIVYAAGTTALSLNPDL